MKDKCFYPLPNYKILDVTKSKASADDKLSVAKMTISLFDKVENTMGKGANAGYKHFLLFLLKTLEKKSYENTEGKGDLHQTLCLKLSSVYFQDVNERAAYVKIDHDSRRCRPGA